MKKSRFTQSDLNKIFNKAPKKEETYLTENEWYITSEDVIKYQKECEKQSKINTIEFYKSLPDLRDKLIGNPIYIEGWEDLKNIESIGDYYLKIENYSGWIYSKKTNEIEQYLSTHTFYGSNYQGSTDLLRRYGFNVDLANWK